MIRSRSRNDRGVAIIAVLVLVALMMTVAVTMSRHAAMEPVSSIAGRQSLEAAEAADSALAVAQGLVSTGQQVTAQQIELGEAQATVSTTDLGSGGIRADVTSRDSSGVGATLVIEGGRMATSGDEPVSHPSALPSVKTDIASAMLADVGVPKLAVAGALTLADQTVVGLVILEANAELTLRNVVVEGAIVSRAAIDGSVIGDFNPSAAPEVLLDGPVRVQPGAFLADVCLVLPNGVLRSTGAPGGFQFDGAVVAHTVDLGPVGSLRGSLAYVDLTLPDTVDRVGAGRSPQPLPDAFEPGAAWETSYMAVLPRTQTAAELTDITDYWSDAEDEEEQQP